MHFNVIRKLIEVSSALALVKIVQENGWLWVTTHMINDEIFRLGVMLCVSTAIAALISLAKDT